MPTMEELQQSVARLQSIVDRQRVAMEAFIHHGDLMPSRDALSSFHPEGYHKMHLQHHSPPFSQGLQRNKQFVVESIATFWNFVVIPLLSWLLVFVYRRRAMFLMVATCVFVAASLLSLSTMIKGATDFPPTAASQHHRTSGDEGAYRLEQRSKQILGQQAALPDVTAQGDGIVVKQVVHTAHHDARPVVEGGETEADDAAIDGSEGKGLAPVPPATSQAFTATKGEAWMPDVTYSISKIDHAAARQVDEENLKPLPEDVDLLNGNITLRDVDIRSTKSTTSEQEQSALDSIFERYSNITSVSELEFITNLPPMYIHLKTKEELADRWDGLERSFGKNTEVDQRRTLVNVACLYAGFVRDFERMFLSCVEYRQKSCSAMWLKAFGNQRAKILDTTHCDVYISTWDIYGGGRFNTNKYKMEETVSPQSITKLYGPRLAGLHIQNYSTYQPVWKNMHHFSHAFPQTRPQTTYYFDAKEQQIRWSGHPETNYFMRINDYSQSYKHWCVVQLALLNAYPYDVFLRLRFDLRATGGIHKLRFVINPNGGEKQVAFDVFRGAPNRLQFPNLKKNDTKQAKPPPLAAASEESDNGDDEAVAVAPSSNAAPQQQPQSPASTPITHYISANRLHAQNFDISDFGFMGTPAMIEHLGSLWYYCLQPPSTLSVTPSAARVSTDMISEYNYMIWRSIFDNKWSVDSGGSWVRVSRRYGQALPSSDSGESQIVRRVIYRVKRVRKV